MIDSKKILLGVAAAATASLWLGYAYFAPSEPAFVATPARLPATASADIALAPSADASNDALTGVTSDAPPWAKPTVKGAAPRTFDPQLAATQTANAERRRALQQIQAELLALQSNPNPDPLAVSALLGRLEQATGLSEVGGLRLDAVRDSLRVVAEVQVLAQDLERIQQAAAANPSDANQQALLKKLAELERANTRLQTSDLVAPRLAATPTPR